MELLDLLNRAFPEYEFSIAANFPILVVSSRDNRLINVGLSFKNNILSHSVFGGENCFETSIANPNCMNEIKEWLEECSKHAQCTKSCPRYKEEKFLPMSC